MCCGIDHWKDYHHGSYAANGNYAVKPREDRVPQRLSLARRLGEIRSAESALEQIAQPLEQSKSAADLFTSLKPETRIYRIVNNRIVGEIAITQLRGDSYYAGESTEERGGDYAIHEDPTITRRTEPIIQQQSNLLALIERARKERSAPWQ